MGSERRGRAVHGRVEVNPSGEEPTDRPRQKNAGLWEPYDGRLSRTVLREREGEVPSRYSPGHPRQEKNNPVHACGDPKRQRHPRAVAGSHHHDPGQQHRRGDQQQAPTHTRRSLSLRAIPEADPHFAKIFGVREDIESTFSNLKYLTRGKLKSTDDDQNLFTFTAYMLLWMSRAKTAYYKSLAANPAQAIPIAA